VVSARSSRQYFLSMGMMQAPLRTKFIGMVLLVIMHKQFRQVQQSVIRLNLKC